MPSTGQGGGTVRARDDDACTDTMSSRMNERHIDTRKMKKTACHAQQKQKRIRMTAAGTTAAATAAGDVVGTAYREEHRRSGRRPEDIPVDKLPAGLLVSLLHVLTHTNMVARSKSITDDDYEGSEIKAWKALPRRLMTAPAGGENKSPHDASGSPSFLGNGRYQDKVNIEIILVHGPRRCSAGCPFGGRES